MDQPVDGDCARRFDPIDDHEIAVMDEVNEAFRPLDIGIDHRIGGCLIGCDEEVIGALDTSASLHR